MKGVKCITGAKNGMYAGAELEQACVGRRQGDSIVIGINTDFGVTFQSNSLVS